MILSNEPGFYKAGEFGIRIENLIVVRKSDAIAGGDREMLEFETITLAPIHLDLIRAEMLNEDERQWLNDYHGRVREQIGPHVPEDMSQWFRQATRAV